MSIRQNLSGHSTQLRAMISCLLFMLVFPGFGQDDVARHLALGDSLMRVDKPQRALVEYERALKLQPSAATYLARAKAWNALDRADRFLLDVEQVLRLDSTSATAHYLRADYAMRGGDMQRVIHHASRCLEYSSDQVERQKALVLRGEARVELKQYPGAILDLEQGLGPTSTDTDALASLARLYDGVGRHADALAILERLCELEPRSVGHWSNRSFELIMLERYDEAMNAVEHALALDKDEPIALSNRAYIHFKQGRLKEAWSDVERSLRSYPANPYALRTRGVLRLQAGDVEKACDDLTLAKVLGEIPEVDQLVKEHCGNSHPPKK